MGVIKRHGWWVVIAVAVAALLWPRFAGREQAVSVPCKDIVAGCMLPQAGANIRFDRQPDALQPFRVFVDWPGVREVHASFRMHGMEMGFNRYALVQESAGQWRGEVMLPACIQGRQDWLVVLDADGMKYELPFASR